ncbi:MAG TPA: hypothetical protein VER36_12560 [Flavisolibacter sp.]|nr:hypothetical protein [Flavisolibacter sp.]
MGRVFTIDFSFEERAGQALVCMYEKGYNILFKIHVFNEDLYSILPAGNLEFSFVDGLKTPHQLQHQKGQQLVSCIAEEISQYLDLEEQNHL